MTSDPTLWTATDQCAAIAAGRLAPSDLMAATLARIDRLNPGVNAIVSLRDHATLMDAARQADRAAPVGPLHGLPFAVKDLVAVAGLRTTWGSPLFADHIPAHDDLLAARLRAAGAIFIGKTNTPEWGHGSHSFNPVFGTTLNPYDTGRSAGGSSGGAAAGLATRMLALADGSDMMGSLRNPAAFCNVYGMRPTWGLVPQDAEGDTYLATLSTDGPMARTPGDLAMLLDVMAGPNPATPFGRAKPAPFAPSPATLAGMRIGWLGDWGGDYATEPGILDICREGLRVFADQGAGVDDLPPPFPATKLWQAWTTLRSFLNAQGMRAIHENPARRAQLKPETQWEIETGLTVAPDALYDASVIRSRWYARAAALFDTYDALVLPAAQVWPFDATWRWPQHIGSRAMDTYHRWMEVVVPASLIGLPVICLPCGFGANGLPMGLQLIGRAGQDRALLDMAEAYHRATDWPGRYPPPAP